MDQKYIDIQFKARYFQLGELNKDTKNLVFVLHGYGQQAKYFLPKFDAIDNGQNCIIAPEGLSKFYLEGFSGRVGANWMTKEDRLTDIHNYTNYLNTIYSHLTGDINFKHLKITIIGFSQGAATASRWASHHMVPFHRLILWAGIFPPDLDYSIAREEFQGKEILYVYGLKDPYLSEARVEEMNKISKDLNVVPKTITFDGDHSIDSETLLKIFL